MNKKTQKKLGPVKFFECLIPNSFCNLKCEYCYVIQQNRRQMKLCEFKYPPEHIAKALHPNRVGGICFINLCAAGETLLQKEVVDIAFHLLKNGHYVNITTNGTITKNIDLLLETCKDYITHLSLCFSFHFIELKNRGLIETYFKNVNKAKSAGCSILLKLNLCDSYIENIEEIKKLFIENVNALPQVALTRNQNSKDYEIFSRLSDEEYYSYGKQFNSPLFEFNYNNFNKKRNGFCYAGKWSATIDLATGILRKCYCNGPEQNIFEDLSKPIVFSPVGYNCNSNYCVNGDWFFALGIMPKYKCPSFIQLRNRPDSNWYSSDMQQFLSCKLSETNKQLPFYKRLRYKLNLTNLKRFARKIIRKK